MTAPCDSTKGTCTTFSEEEFGKRMDRCLTDVLMKTSGGLVMGTIISLLIFRQRKWPIILGGGVGAGVAFSGGFVIGTVVSVLFFRRRAWPIILGGGFGTGVAYRNCEKELNK